MKLLQLKASSTVSRSIFRVSKREGGPVSVSPENVIDAIKPMKEVAQEVSDEIEKHERLQHEFAQKLVEKMGGAISRAEYQALATEMLRIKSGSHRVQPSARNDLAQKLEDAVKLALETKPVAAKTVELTQEILADDTPSTERSEQIKALSKQLGDPAKWATLMTLARQILSADRKDTDTKAVSTLAQRIQTILKEKPYEAPAAAGVENFEGVPLQRNAQRLKAALKRAGFIKADGRTDGYLRGLLSNIENRIDRPPNFRLRLTVITLHLLPELESGRLNVRLSGAEIDKKFRAANLLFKHMTHEQRIKGHSQLAEKQLRKLKGVAMPTAPGLEPDVLKTYPSFAHIAETFNHADQTQLLETAQKHEWSDLQLSKVAALLSAIDIAYTNERVNYTHHNSEKAQQIEALRKQIFAGNLDFINGNFNFSNGTDPVKFFKQLDTEETNPNANKVARVAGLIGSVSTVMDIRDAFREKAEPGSPEEAKKQAEEAPKLMRLLAFVKAVDARASRDPELARAVLVAQESIATGNLEVALIAVQKLVSRNLGGIFFNYYDSDAEDSEGNSVTISAEGLAEDPEHLVEALRDLKDNFGAMRQATIAALDEAPGLEDAKTFMDQYILEKGPDPDVLSKATKKYENILHALKSQNPMHYEAFKAGRAHAINNIANDMLMMGALEAYVTSKGDSLDSEHPLMDTINDMQGLTGWNNLSDADLATTVNVISFATFFMGAGMFAGLGRALGGIAKVAFKVPGVAPTAQALGKVAAGADRVFKITERMSRLCQKFGLKAKVKLPDGTTLVRGQEVLYTTKKGNTVRKYIVGVKDGGVVLSHSPVDEALLSAFATNKAINKTFGFSVKDPKLIAGIRPVSTAGDELVTGVSKLGIEGALVSDEAMAAIRAAANTGDDAALRQAIVSQLPAGANVGSAITERTLGVVRAAATAKDGGSAFARAMRELGTKLENSAAGRTATVVDDAPVITSTGSAGSDVVTISRTTPGSANRAKDVVGVAPSGAIKSPRAALTPAQASADTLQVALKGSGKFDEAFVAAVKAGNPADEMAHVALQAGKSVDDVAQAFAKAGGLKDAATIGRLVSTRGTKLLKSLIASTENSPALLGNILKGLGDDFRTLQNFVIASEGNLFALNVARKAVPRFLAAAGDDLVALNKVLAIAENVGANIPQLLTGMLKAGRSLDDVVAMANSARLNLKSVIETFTKAGGKADELLIQSISRGIAPEKFLAVAKAAALPVDDVLIQALMKGGETIGPKVGQIVKNTAMGSESFMLKAYNAGVKPQTLTALGKALGLSDDAVARIISPVDNVVAGRGAGTGLRMPAGSEPVTRGALAGDEAGLALNRGLPNSGSGIKANSGIGPAKGPLSTAPVAARTPAQLSADAMEGALKTSGKFDEALFTAAVKAGNPADEIARIALEAGAKSGDVVKAFAKAGGLKDSATLGRFLASPRVDMNFLKAVIASAENSPALLGNILKALGDDITALQKFVSASQGNLFVLSVAKKAVPRFMAVAGDDLAAITRVLGIAREAGADVTQLMVNLIRQGRSLDDIVALATNTRHKLQSVLDAFVKGGGKIDEWLVQSISRGVHPDKFIKVAKLTKQPVDDLLVRALVEAGETVGPNVAKIIQSAGLNTEAFLLKALGAGVKRPVLTRLGKTLGLSDDAIKSLLNTADDVSAGRAAGMAPSAPAAAAGSGLNLGRAAEAARKGVSRRIGPALTGAADAGKHVVQAVPKVPRAPIVGAAVIAAGATEATATEVNKSEIKDPRIEATPPEKLSVSPADIDDHTPDEMPEKEKPLAEKIAAIGPAEIRGKAVEIKPIITEYLKNYTEGDWQDVSVKMAKLFGLELSTEEEKLAFGDHIQKHVRAVLGLPNDAKDLADRKVGKVTLDRLEATFHQVSPAEIKAIKPALLAFENTGNWRSNNTTMAVFFGLNLNGADEAVLRDFGRSVQRYAGGTDGKIGPNTIKNLKAKLESETA